MKNVLSEIDVPLETLRVLEVFGRDGTSNVDHYYGKVKSVEIWEINSKYRSILEQKFPKASIHIRDSIKTLERYNSFFSKDLIILDCPSQTYGRLDSGDVYCECFDVLPNIGKLFRGKTILVMNVWDKQPENSTDEWDMRRELFYNMPYADELGHDFLDDFYIKYFKKLSIDVKMIKHIRRGPSLCYYMLWLEK